MKKLLAAVVGGLAALTFGGALAAEQFIMEPGEYSGTIRNGGEFEITITKSDLKTIEGRSMVYRGHRACRTPAPVRGSALPDSSIELSSYDVIPGCERTWRLKRSESGTFEGTLKGPTTNREREDGSWPITLKKQK